MSRQEASLHPVFTARSPFAAHRQTKRKARRRFYAPDLINPINKKGKSIRKYKVSVRRLFKDSVYLQDRLCTEVTSSPRAEFISFIWNCFWETDCVRPNNRSAGMQPTARKCVRLFFKLSRAENPSRPARSDQWGWTQWPVGAHMVRFQTRRASKIDLTWKELENRRAKQDLIQTELDTNEADFIKSLP